MTDIGASEVVPAPREAVFEFLSDLGNHWAVAGRWIEVVAVDGKGDGGHVRIRGPLGLHRTAVTSDIATTSWLSPQPVSTRANSRYVPPYASFGMST